jgi:hypothetical protein
LKVKREKEKGKRGKRLRYGERAKRVESRAGAGARALINERPEAKSEEPMGNEKGTGK